MQRVKNAIYKIVLKLATLRPVRIQKNTLLIVKTDEIGDYVLWRNMLPWIKNSKRFKGYHITLCGNKAWKQLAFHFDKEHADDFIWYDKNAFKTKMRYRYDFLKTIHKCGFEIVLNPTFSRSAREDDAIVRACPKAFKIGMQRNSHNVSSFEENYDRNLYDELHNLPMIGLFEFNRNCEFTSRVLKEVYRPNFGFDDAAISPSAIEGKYAVIFPGSRISTRRWPIDNFVKVASFLKTQYDLQIVVAGSTVDAEACMEFEKKFPLSCTNLAMKTSLLEFVGLLAGAECLISIDTGSVHLAAAAGCKVYSIFNGSQYGRYAPYPDGIAKKDFYAIFPTELESNIKTGKIESYQYFSPIPYHSITAEQVLNLINK